MRIERRIPAPETPQAQRRESALLAALASFPNADQVSLCFYAGRYLAEVWDGPSARIYEVGA